MVPRGNPRRRLRDLGGEVPIYGSAHLIYYDSCLLPLSMTRCQRTQTRRCAFPAPVPRPAGNRKHPSDPLRSGPRAAAGGDLHRYPVSDAFANLGREPISGYNAFSRPEDDAKVTPGLRGDPAVRRHDHVAAVEAGAAGRRPPRCGALPVPRALEGRTSDHAGERMGVLEQVGKALVPALDVGAPRHRCSRGGPPRWRASARPSSPAPPRGFRRSPLLQAAPAWRGGETRETLLNQSEANRFRRAGPSGGTLDREQAGHGRARVESVTIPPITQLRRGRDRHELARRSRPASRKCPDNVRGRRIDPADVEADRARSRHAAALA